MLRWATDRKEIAMHYLHKILVHFDREMVEYGLDLKTHAYITATDETEAYEHIAYDWRKENAGRWKDIYPEKAYLASDDLDWFLNELEETVAFQKAAIDQYLYLLAEDLGTDLSVITEKLWNCTEDREEKSEVDTFLCACYLSSQGQLLSGEYSYESRFYNTERRTARLYPSDIELIKQNPEEWALVMLDYHY